MFLREPVKGPRLCLIWILHVAAFASWQMPKGLAR